MTDDSLAGGSTYNAETAVKFYASIFKNSRITTVTHYGEAGARASGRPVGTVMTIAFQLEAPALPER